MPKLKTDSATVETKNINARIPKELAKKLKVYCAEHDTTIQELLIQAIHDKLKAKKK